MLFKVPHCAWTVYLSQLFLAWTIYMVVIKQAAEEAKVCISLMLQEKKVLFLTQMGISLGHISVEFK